MQALAQTSWMKTPGDGLGTSYSTLQVSQILNAQTVFNGTAAIRPGGIRRTRGRIIHTDKSLAPIQDLTTSVQRVTLTFDGNASITRSCEMQFRRVPGPYGGMLGQFTKGTGFPGGPQHVIDVYHDRCLIYIDVGAPDGGWLSWLVGTFLWTIPEDTITPSSRSNVVQLHDYAQFLIDQKFQTPQILYGISDGRSIGDNYIGLNPSEAIDNGVLGLLAQAGFGTKYPAPNIVPVAQTILNGYGPITATNQGLDVTWPWGTTFLKAINDSLAANSYYPLWFDHTGAPTSSPILPTIVTGTYTTPAPVYSYTTDPHVTYALPNGTQTALCILPPIVSRADLSNLANVVQVSSDDPLSPVGYIARNYSPSNPIHTSRASDATSIAAEINNGGAGRDIYKLVTDNNLTSADVAYYRTQVETIRASAVYHQLSLNTILHPALEAHDWVQVYAGPDNDVSGRGELLSFIMEIRVGSPNNIGNALQSGGVANATNQTSNGGAASLRYMTQTIQIVEDLNSGKPSILFTGLGNPAASNHEWVLGTATS